MASGIVRWAADLNEDKSWERLFSGLDKAVEVFFGWDLGLSGKLEQHLNQYLGEEKRPGVVLGPGNQDTYSTEENIDYYAVLRMLINSAPNNSEDQAFWNSELASVMGLLRNTL